MQRMCGRQSAGRDTHFSSQAAQVIRLKAAVVQVQMQLVACTMTSVNSDFRSVWPEVPEEDILHVNYIDEQTGLCECQYRVHVYTELGL